MKKLLIIPIILMSCMQDINKEPSEPEFNPKKDSIIIECLKEKIFVFNKKEHLYYENTIIYTLQFKHYEFTIIHKLHIPFECKEEWVYYCKDINGNNVFINPEAILWQDRCSKKMAARLSNEYCLTHEHDGLYLYSQ